jgi:hypothetical protein
MPLIYLFIRKKSLFHGAGNPLKAFEFARVLASKVF